MTEAPHGTAPALEGKDIANPMAMILAVGGAAALRRRARRLAGGRRRASRAVYEAVLEAAAAGVRTPDLGGHATTTRVHRRGDRARAHEARDLVEPPRADVCRTAVARRRLAGVEERRSTARRGDADRARARADGDAALRGARLAAAGALRATASCPTTPAGTASPTRRPIRSAYEYADLVGRPRGACWTSAGSTRAVLVGRVDGRRDDARVRAARIRSGSRALVQITPGASRACADGDPRRAGALGRARGRARARRRRGVHARLRRPARRAERFRG